MARFNTSLQSMEAEMRYSGPILAAATLVMAVSPSLAQDVERYQIERTDEGYVRLDTTNGRMTLCQERGGQLVCKMAVEERTAYEDQLDELQARVDALEDRLAALESGQPAAQLPSEEEFEQTLGYMERFFRRFLGIVQDLDREYGRGERPSEPPADRT